MKGMKRLRDYYDDALRLRIVSIIRLNLWIGNNFTKIHPRLPIFAAYFINFHVVHRHFDTLNEASMTISINLRNMRKCALSLI